MPIFFILLCVGVLWGFTNPFLKRGSEGIQHISAETKMKKFLLELKFLITKPSYLCPFLLNQCGSVLFILALQDSNLSFVVPITNSLSYVFTTIVGHVLGERLTKSAVIGTIFISLGSTLLIWDKF